MSLRDDIKLALRLLNRPLSPDTKPTEREARAAARRVTHAITDLLFKIDDDIRGQDAIPDDRPGVSPTIDEILNELAFLGTFLIELGFNFDPTFRPKNLNRIYTRKVDFSDATQGSGRTRAAQARHFAIALRVRELRKAGAKAPVRTTAEEFNTVSSDVSRICADPDIKGHLDFEDTIDWEIDPNAI
jgi:hypothetical protein